MATKAADPFILECFKGYIAGKLLKGIVHNLNGPIQVLSMQAELLGMGMRKGLSNLASLSQLPEKEQEKIETAVSVLKKNQDRIVQAQEVLGQLKEMVEVIARGASNESVITQPAPLKEILNSQLLFWNGDNFFKHQVEKNVTLEENPWIRENVEILRFIVDCLLGSCIEQLHGVEEATLNIFVSRENEQHYCLDFSHNGRPFPRSWKHIVASAFLKGPVESSVDESSPFLIAALNIARTKAEQLKWSIAVEEQKVSCSFHADAE